MTRLPYSHLLNDGYNYQWHFDFPWHLFKLREWFYKSWLDLGQRRGDDAIVSHRGHRFLGFRRDEWIVHNPKK